MQASSAVSYLGDRAGWRGLQDKGLAEAEEHRLDDCYPEESVVQVIAEFVIQTWADVVA